MVRRRGKDGANIYFRYYIDGKQITRGVRGSEYHDTRNDPSKSNAESDDDERESDDDERDPKVTIVRRALNILVCACCFSSKQRRRTAR